MSVTRVGWRARKIQRLAELRVGHGAATLPPIFNGLHLEFSTGRTDGHLGPRLFWRDYLKRLKYHNPGTPMIVNRKYDQAGPATLSIYLRSDDADQLPQKPTNFAHNKKTGGGDENDPWALIRSHTHGGTPAPEARPGEKRIQIDAKWLSVEGIWTAFLKESGATPLKLTEEEQNFLIARDDARRKRNHHKRELAERKRLELDAKARMDAAIAEAAALKQG